MKIIVTGGAGFIGSNFVYYMPLCSVKSDLSGAILCLFFRVSVGTRIGTRNAALQSLVPARCEGECRRCESRGRSSGF